MKPVDGEDNIKKLDDFKKGETIWVLKDSDFRDFIFATYNEKIPVLKSWAR